MCLNSLHYMLVFQQRNSNLIQTGFVVCAFYRPFLNGSLRMSEKCCTLKGFGFKKARPIDDRKIWKKSFERKEENAVNQQFSFFFFSIFSILLRKTVRVLGYISIYLSFAYTSNLDLPKILSFGKGWKVVGKEEITCHMQFYPFP